MSSTASKAARTASTISVVRIALIVFNVLGFLVVLIAGIGIAKPDTPFGEVDSVGVLMVVAGFAGALFGSLVIHVVFGWFEGMLATNAELVRQGEDDHKVVDFVTGREFDL